MVKFFTGTGDDGTTGLLGEGRVKKYDFRMETLGTIDELSAALGLARSFGNSSHGEIIKKIQVHLYEIMAEIAASEQKQLIYRKIDDTYVYFLEQSIEQVSTGLASPHGFILPGDTQSAAALSMARAICRRAERRVVELFDEGVIENKAISVYFNRLSSLLYVMEVKEASTNNKKPSMAKEQSQ